MFKLKALAPVAVGLAAAAVFAVAPAAHATTGNCASILGTTCGTFQGQDTESTPANVFWDVKGGAAVANQPVIGYAFNTNGDAASDFGKVRHVGNVPGVATSNPNTVSYSFVFTPNGKWTNLCVADTGTHVLVLRSCNGLQWQRFFAEPGTVDDPARAFNGTTNNGYYVHAGGTYTLENAAFHLFVQDHSGVPPTTKATPDTRQLVDSGIVSNVQNNQVWTWTGA